MHVDTSSDILNAGKGGVVEGAGPVNGSAHGLNGTEAADGLQLRVVGDEEGSADFSELGEGDVGQGGAVDEGEGFSDHGQVGSRDGREGGGEEAQVAGDIVESLNADGLDVTERGIGCSEKGGKADCELGRVG